MVPGQEKPKAPNYKEILHNVNIPGVPGQEKPNTNFSNKQIPGHEKTKFIKLMRAGTGTGKTQRVRVCILVLGWINVQTHICVVL